MIEEFEDDFFEDEEDLITDEKKLYQQMYDKIDIYKVFKQVKFKPHKGQRQMYSVISDSKVWFTTCSAGRRFGKTDGLAALATARCALPFASVLLLAPTHSNATNLYKKAQLYASRLGIKIVAKDKSRLSFSLENGSTFSSVYVKNIESALGGEFSTIIVDEAAIMSQEFLEEAVERNLVPTLAGYGVNKHGVSYGEVIMISSPRRAKGYFHSQFKKGKRKLKGYGNVQLPTSSNPYIPKEFLAQKKATLPDYIYKTEYEGQFDDASGNSVFYGFNSSHIVTAKDVKLDLLPESSEHLVGLDYGFTDSTSGVFIYVEKFSGRYVICGEYMCSRVSIGTHAKAYKQKELELNFKEPTRYADPSGSLITATLATDHNYYAMNGMNSIQDSVDVINTLFNENKIVVLDTCGLLIETLELMEWKDTADASKSKDPFKKDAPKHLGHWDLAASLRYAIYTHQKMGGGFTIHSV